MSKVRWGLLSTANINKAVIPSIRNSPRGELAAVASRTPELAASYAKQWEIPHSFGSYEAMLASGAVDAIYNPLPNHLHAEWSIRAMRRGIHVLCEKPFAITLDEVDAMTAASKETGTVLAEAFMYRHHPQTKLIGGLVRAGKVGEVTVVRGAFDFAMRDPETNVRMNPAWGGGCLWDVGVYPLSYAQFIMGCPPLRVAGAQRLGKSGVDEVFAGWMDYPGGQIAQFSCSFRTPFHTFIEIVGTAGRIHIPRPFVSQTPEHRITFHPAHGAAEEIAVPHEYLYNGEIEDMHDAILDGKPNYLTLDETRSHIRTVLALYQSANTGQVVHL
jgi:predicted dehydrogenase